MPTMQPSETPSIQPSFLPTSIPSASSIPSVIPSAMPTYTQNSVLELLYTDTGGGTYWTDNTWTFSGTASECTFNGITCTGMVVTGIDLSSFGLVGYIDDDVFSTLSDLYDINVSNNPELSGRLPTTIGLLSQLRYLDISYTGITGAIPSQIVSKAYTTILNSLLFIALSCQGDASFLERINMKESSLHGELPSQIGELSSLIYLDLRKSSISGSLPSELGRLTSLVFLDLGRTKLGKT